MAMQLHDTSVRTEIDVEAPIRVLAYDPPHRVCFSRDINLQWQLETDPTKTSEIDVTFSVSGENRTHVVLTHRNLDRHGDGWEGMRAAVGSGWNLAGFAAAAGEL